MVIVPMVSDADFDDVYDRFPEKVCINLNRRPDRWLQMQAKCERYGIRGVERFPAIDGERLTLPPAWSGSNGAYGCLLSHLQVVTDARERGQSSVLIFEDDVVLNDHHRQQLAENLNHLPEDWEILYWGANHVQDPVHVSGNVYRVRRSYSTFAYALKHTVFDDFIELNRQGSQPVDVNNFALQQRHNAYCFLPHLAWVEADYSDVHAAAKNHWYIKESLLIFGDRMSRMFAETVVVMVFHDRARTRHAVDNLIFLSGYYSRNFPSIEVVVVDQGGEPAISPQQLPPDCRYVRVSVRPELDRAACWQAGIDAAGPEKKFVILSDSHIHMSRPDIRGNLSMCQRCDATTGFGNLLELTEQETAQLRDSDAKIDFSRAGPPSDNPRQGVCTFLRREVADSIVDICDNHSFAGRDSQIEHEGRPLRIFLSPNRALRLFEG